MLLTTLDLFLVGALLLPRGMSTSFLHAKLWRRSALLGGETENVFSNPPA